ncbi:MAG TPA: (d)CMP kinase [Candidatus Acidoferrales bacterium]|nr:(d)CMP kinase [Candidatus Acidoferrales bacterium]
MAPPRGKKKIIVTIDGPAGAGKSTVAKRLAKVLGFLYMDTGAMYRALALKVMRSGVDPENAAEVTRILRETTIDLRNDNGESRVVLDGADVSDEIRAPEVSQWASKVSTLKAVRERMLELQRKMAAQGKVVAEGRDMGTVVFPDAALKIYLDASPEERARRRVAEIRSRGGSATWETTLAETIERDERDRTRALAPLRKADDAVVIDSTAMDVDQVVGRIEQEIHARRIE